MRKRDVVGRKIVDVRRDSIYQDGRCVESKAAVELILDNGSRIYANVYETEDQPMAAFEVIKKGSSK